IRRTSCAGAARSMDESAKPGHRPQDFCRSAEFPATSGVPGPLQVRPSDRPTAPQGGTAVNNSQRSTYAAMFIVDAMESFANVFFFAPEDWTEVPCDDTDHRPFGFIPPLPYEGIWLVLVCPD